MQRDHGDPPPPSSSALAVLREFGCRNRFLADLSRCAVFTREGNGVRFDPINLVNVPLLGLDPQELTQRLRSTSSIGP